MGDFPDIINMFMTWLMGLCTGMGIGAAIASVRHQKEMYADLLQVEQE